MVKLEGKKIKQLCWNINLKNNKHLCKKHGGRKLRLIYNVNIVHSSIAEKENIVLV